MTENFAISLTGIELMLVQPSAIKSSLIKSLANPGLNILLKVETCCSHEWIELELTWFSMIFVEFKAYYFSIFYEIWLVPA